MSNIKPFASLRPEAQLAKQVASKPYDVLNSAEAKIEAQGNPTCNPVVDSPYGASNVGA